MEDWDWNQDGELDEGEFLELCTYMDEDQYLTPEEADWALQQYENADPENAIWLTDTFSSAAGGEGHMQSLGYDDFINFGMKLGGEEWELDEMWWEADKNDDGTLDLVEQDNIWWSLMEENDDYDNDIVDHLWDIEESAWDILDTVWEAQYDM